MGAVVQSHQRNGCNMYPYTNHYSDMYAIGLSVYDQRSQIGLEAIVVSLTTLYKA